jgi:hypothetical protein
VVARDLARVLPTFDSKPWDKWRKIRMKLVLSSSVYTSMKRFLVDVFVPPRVYKEMTPMKQISPFFAAFIKLVAPDCEEMLRSGDESPCAKKRMREARQELQPSAA